MTEDLLILLMVLSGAFGLLALIAEALSSHEGARVQARPKPKSRSR